MKHIDTNKKTGKNKQADKQTIEKQTQAIKRTSKKQKKQQIRNQPT